MNSLNYGGSEAFGITARALLHGYRAKAKGDAEKVAVQCRLINVVVFGSSAEHARYYVEQTLRENLPNNMLCFGHNVSPSEFLNTVVNGHVIVLPELEFMKEQYWYDVAGAISNLVNASRSNSDGYNGEFNSVHVHFPHAGMEDMMRGALYERWLGSLSHNLPHVIPYGVTSHFNQLECSSSMMRDELPHDIKKLTLSHLAPVIEGRTVIKGCGTPVFIGNDLADSSRIWAILDQLKCGERQVYVADSVLKAMYSSLIDFRKDFGPVFSRTAKTSGIVPEQRTVKEL